jgi:NAD(P)-dependent dehydrogenase (short-subunit alcohol dehydrogenase family)
MPSAFAGKVVVVTGASGGIGGAVAKALATRGANLILVDRSKDGLQERERELSKSGSSVLALQLDVTSEDDMARMAETALHRHGRLDALVAAAGILRTSGEPRPVVDTDFSEWRTIIDVNLGGVFLSNRAVLPAMIAQGEGDIINISSVSGREGRAFDGPYCASKFGIIGLSESIAEEVSRLGVRVQTVLPDAVDTQIWNQSGTVSLRPRDLLSPDSVAEFILFLLALPRDTFLMNPRISPTRRRTRKANAPGREATS